MLNVEENQIELKQPWCCRSLRSWNILTVLKLKKCLMLTKGSDFAKNELINRQFFRDLIIHEAAKAAAERHS